MIGTHLPIPQISHILTHKKYLKREVSDHLIHPTKSETITWVPKYFLALNKLHVVFLPYYGPQLSDEFQDLIKYVLSKFIPGELI